MYNKRLLLDKFIDKAYIRDTAALLYSSMHVSSAHLFQDLS